MYFFKNISANEVWKSKKKKKKKNQVWLPYWKAICIEKKCIYREEREEDLRKKKHTKTSAHKTVKEHTHTKHTLYYKTFRFRRSNSQTKRGRNTLNNRSKHKRKKNKKIIWICVSACWGVSVALWLIEVNLREKKKRKSIYWKKLTSYSWIIIVVFVWCIRVKCKKPQYWIVY